MNDLGRSIVSCGVVAALLLTLANPAVATVPGENGQIAFVSDRDGNNEIYAINSDGSGLIRLTNNIASDSEPDWSPDGRQIAFTSDRTGQPAVHVMNADGSGVRLLGEGGAPSWSPDGRRLAFLSGPAFVSGRSVWIMNADGTSRTRVTNPLADTNRQFPPGQPLFPRWDSRPRWSPDGTRIMFNRVYEAFVNISFTVAPSGGQPQVISEFINSEANDWAPNASMIVGFRVPVGLTFAGASLFAIDPGGALVFEVPRATGLMHMVDPAWSPNGALLAHANSPTRDTTSPAFMPPEIAITPAGSLGGLVNLTNHPASDSQPAWQPLNPYPIGLVDPTTGIWYLRSASAAVISFYFGNPGDFPMVGDWDGDGIDTPGLYRQSDGFVYLRNSNTQGIADLSFFFGNPGDIPLAGDFDGDGRDTVSIYRPSESRIYVMNHLGSGGAGLGSADHAYFFGDPGDKPFVGDFNGDGVDTVGLHRETTGLIYFRNSHTEGIAHSSFLFGDPGDRVVAFDWNNDGADSAAVFRPANSKFYLRFTSTVGAADREFFIGQGSWLPVVGEFGLP